MKARREPRPPRPSEQSFLAFAREAPVFPFEWHYHPEFELTWIERGAGTRFVGDTVAPYAPGDLVLLGGDLPHTWSSETPARRAGAHRAVVVQFAAELFAAQSGPEFLAVRDLLARAGRGLVFNGTPVAAEEWHALAQARGLDAWCRLATLLNRLARAESSPIASVGYRPAPRHGALRRHERALAFIAGRADAGPVYLKDAARSVHLTPAAFSRFFQRMAGVSFVAHVNALRIARATRLLIETDRAVADIAYTCGFGNLANFNRRFRALKGEAPLRFRRRYEAGGT